MHILVINPGGTSTKIAVFSDDQQIFKKTIHHSYEDLASYPRVFDEYPLRRELVLRTLAENGIALEQIDAIAGRGGLMRPIPGGTYAVNDRMIEDLRQAVNGEHASNLGALLARTIADEIGVPAFVVDPVCVDEFEPSARITGLSDLEKASWLHALNQKAVCRQVAEEMGRRYEDLNFIVAHLGSGISIAAHRNGRMIDGSGGRSDGPFSPERSGGLPAYPLIELCYSGRYSRAEMVQKVSSSGGMQDYLGTKDMVEIQARVNGGDETACQILDAFIYQVAKEIAMYGAVLCGRIDRIILTGGIAHSNTVVAGVRRRVDYLAPVVVIPGELEMEALAKGAWRVMSGQEAAKVYQ